MTSPAQSAHLPPGVEAPRYARSDLTVGIVHIGVGGFHRSHQAMYLDRLMNQGLARDWAICGVGLLPGDARMRDVLRAQDHRYTLVLRHPDGHEEVRVVGSLADYLFVPDDPAAVVSRMADPATRLGQGGDRLSARSRTRDRSGRLHRDAARAVRESGHRRHPRPAGRRDLGPDPEVPPSRRA